MLRLRTLLVDDETLALNLLAFECRRFGYVEVVGVARDGRSAAELIEKERPDLVLLDIEMPGLDGLEVAAEAQRPGPQFVFVTAHPGYAVEAFGLEAADYLLKPVAPERLAAAFERVQRRLRERMALKEVSPAGNESVEDVLWLKGASGYVRLTHAEVLWVEAERDYVLLHTAKRAYLFRSSLAAMRDRLGAQAMLQVHRSALVRRSSIHTVRPSPGGGLRVVLDHGAEVPVGRSYLSLVARTLGVPRRKAGREDAADD